ncbi:putative Late embryogenesis abundant protein, LEA_2 subgroup [Helianthus anomalus]
MPKPPTLGRQRRTNPVVWCFAIVCSIIATTVIIAGIVIFSGYLVLRPKVPLLSVRAARLDSIYYNGDVFAVKLMVVIRAENHNRKAHASFYDTRLLLGYHGVRIARLVADPFDVPRNGTVDLNYVVESSPIPLPREEQYLTDQSMKKSRLMLFVLKGSSKTMWKVGPLGEVKFTLHMDCELVLPVNGSVLLHSRCSTKSH